MCSRFLSLLLLVTGAACGASIPGKILRVCADPNNLPFSNQRGEGFENRIAELIARQMDAKVAYTWWTQRRNYVRNTLNAGRCDVIAGLPAGTTGVLTTTPYYESTYVIVSRREVRPPVRTLDDPRLAKLRIGAHVVNDNFAPPVHALARRGVRNVRGYSLFGAFEELNPPARLLEALTKNDIDVALVWGPFAGYFAPKELAVEPVSPPRDGPIPFTYGVSMAVRSGDSVRLEQIQHLLSKNKREIEAILREFRVPGVAGGRR
jgi:mxaJ protein